MKILPNDTLYECNSKEHKIVSNGICFLTPTNNYWETDLKLENLVMYFVYPQLTSSYSSCEEAQKHQLMRYQLTKEDLDQMNWMITYP
ncbi:MAG: hypothetical protein LBI60_01335 [Bacteroidales bacterium]|nr:hypothetical protein [Bacteroidales bacterium]